MEVRISVNDLPPKKDGASSMWGKRAEVPRLKALREVALLAFGGSPTLFKEVEMEIRLYADPKAGDLDNFITGICDGLMAAHPRTPIHDPDWSDLPPDAHPRKPIVFSDDSVVKRIVAERFDHPTRTFRYELIIRRKKQI